MNRCAYIFLDEAGNFDFSPKGTRYFCCRWCSGKLQQEETEHYDRIKPAVRSEDNFFRSVTRASGGLTDP